MLRATKVGKTFSTAAEKVAALVDITFSIPSGEGLALVGPSGSGKSTLLGLLGGMDIPSSGTIAFEGTTVSDLGEDDRARFRTSTVGFIFQSFLLIPTLTALENVLVPAELRGDFSAVGRATELLNAVGLGARTRHFPAQLSGGEQQRVALARACINRPKLILADEPTGNLDRDNAGQVQNLLFELQRSAGSTLVVATHDIEFAAKLSHRVVLEHGRMIEEIAPTRAAP